MKEMYLTDGNPNRLTQGHVREWEQGKLLLTGLLVFLLLVFHLG